mmetsp:Transcript_14974/g.44724  ORF Transcript_14974/g.44724 Transcript_14974/m.44724 type:complete len:333 (+) Transcript_14974:176-1174(+)
MGLVLATWEAFLATCFTWFVTACGAALVFVLPSDEATQRRVLTPMLGFAGGVMTSASFFSLLAPALELAEASYGSRWAFLPVAIGFALGGAGMIACDAYMERHGNLDPLELMQQTVLGSPRNRKYKAEPPVNGATPTRDGARRRPARPTSMEAGRPSFSFDSPDDEDSALRKAAAAKRAVALLVFAVTLHNFPEGLAVGVGFGGAAAGVAGASRAKARNLAIGIGLQNFPEGLAVSLPLRRAGLSPRRAFLFGQLSGAVEPIGGVLGACLVVVVRPLLPYALAFAAGAMIYVVVDQLVPEALEGRRKDSGRQSTLGFMCGFLLMMVMDVALG